MSGISIPGIVTGSSVSCSITLIRRAACNWWWTTIRDRRTTNSRPGMARVATGPTLSKAPTSGVCACGICGTEGGERFARIPPKYPSRDRRIENISWQSKMTGGRSSSGRAASLASGVLGRDASRSVSLRAVQSLWQRPIAKVDNRTSQNLAQCIDA